MRKRHDPLEGEQKDRVSAMLDQGMKRGDICKAEDVSYIQLQKTFGFKHKKGPRKNGPVTTVEASSN